MLETPMNDRLLPNADIFDLRLEFQEAKSEV